MKKLVIGLVLAVLLFTATVVLLDGCGSLHYLVSDFVNN